MYRQFFKPLLDKLVALIGFIILSPLFVLATVLLFFANHGKPFFFQPRPGRKGRIFRIIKFKTMNDTKGADGQLLSDEKRLTVVGKVVRKTSIDEIPQLLNVLIGDMSLIGPRPLLSEYLPLYNERQRRRHEVRPGITGWAQVNGRNSISWEQKFELDAYYVDNISFLLDVKILLMTVVNVFRGKGISQEGAATMEKFKGTPKQQAS